MCSMAELIINNLVSDWKETEDYQELASQYPDRLEDLEFLYLSIVFQNVGGVLRTSKVIISNEVIDDAIKKWRESKRQEFEKFDNRDKLREAFPMTSKKEIETLHSIFLKGEFDKFCEWIKSYNKGIPRSV